tara:strand:- start:532 stop:738 length:207 start_codon:yes stop_codon:yes gene_type:complete
MRKLIDLESFLPESDWQRLETWAAMAGVSPLDYIKVCVRRGHELISKELITEENVALRPISEDCVSDV